MDLVIKQHLAAAQNNQDTQALQNAYDIMKTGSRISLDMFESFSSNLYIICAEQALQLGNIAMSKDCVEMYFKGKPISNQFIGRAYLCQSQFYIPQSVDDVKTFEKSLVYLLKAIAFAKPQPRYYFLIYNASILHWQLARPFLRPGYRHVVIPSLIQIIKALEQVHEEDHDWRATLIIELLECFLDAGKIKEATEFATNSSAYIKLQAAHEYPKLFALKVRHKLIDSAKAAKESQESIVLTVIYKIQTFKRHLETSELMKDYSTQLQEIYELLAQQSIKQTFPERINLLVELTRLSLELNCTQLAFACIRELKNAGITDPRKLIEIECLECVHDVQKLGSAIPNYTKSAIETQLIIVRRLELALQNAVRLEDPHIAQMVCVTQWNLCLPLLQQNLRKHLRKPLLFVAEILEKIDSLLILLRCQVHMEVAQMEEDEERLEVAMKHLKKAMSLDQNGQYEKRLRMAYHRLQLQIMLYQKPESLEDQAALMIEQAKKEIQNGNLRKNRPLLIKAGLALATDEFQIVLDSENEAKVSSGKGNKDLISQLCMKAHHHIQCVEKLDGYFKRLENKNDSERVYLWAAIAKVARKQEVWDVCRAACRFCLLYDDGRWKTPASANSPKKRRRKSESVDYRASYVELHSFSFERDLLRIFSEIRFINAEATIHLLRSEGAQLNEHAILPRDQSRHSVGYVPKYTEQNPEWITYRNWITQLSQYATENFERAAELAVELNEAWITHNAVVYVLNYNKHIIATRRQKELVHTLKILFNAVQSTGYHENTALVVMMCNALAQGMIHAWIPLSTIKKAEAEPQPEKGKKKKSAGKGTEKSNALQVLSVDPNGFPDVKMALEVCEFALDLINKTIPDEMVPIAVQQQIIATWVKIKQLCQQQIGHKLGTDEENTYEWQNLMSRVLVAVEMHACNNLGFMDFAVPNLSQLMKMASECTWSDLLVELQTLTRLTNFAYKANDHDLVMICSQKVLQLDKMIIETSNMKKHEMYTYAMEKEMLSTAACIQGQSIMRTMSGKKHLLILALKAFEESARYGGEAGSSQLVMLAAKHFWNASSALVGSPEDRKILEESIVSILKAVVKTESKNKQETENEVSSLHLWPTRDTEMNNITSGHSPTDVSSGEDDIKLITALYGLLFQIHADRNNWEGGLMVLDEAIQILPRTKHRLMIFKHRVLVKSRLGQNFMMDIQKFKDESEDYLSYMWHSVALTSRDIMEELTCYRNAIEVLQKSESEWQKVEYLMDLARWLYCNRFPISNALNLLDWAVDILLQMNLRRFFEEEGKIRRRKSKIGQKSSSKDQAKVDTKSSDMGKEDKQENLDQLKQSSVNNASILSSRTSVEDLKHIRQLEALMRAHTLMAVLSGHHSPYHQEHCLMAYSYVMLIWQVSLPAAGSFIKIQAKNAPSTETQSPQSPPSKKGKGKQEPKKAPPPSPKEKAKRKGPLDVLPASIEEWASYDCPDEVRDAFKSDTSCFSINRINILEPMYSLYYLDLLVKELQSISFTHLTLPVLQLAEVIAQDVVESKSLSDLYHLRLTQVCGNLKLSNSASYHEKEVGTVFINEQEQASCRQEILLKEKMSQVKKVETNDFFDQAQDISRPVSKPVNSNEKIMELSATGKGLNGLSFPYLWIAKADVLIQLSFYQPARHLLAEAHKACQEMDDKYAASKCLYLLAVLANQENNYGQAKILSEEVQQIDADAEFWYKTTLNLIQAVLKEEKAEKEKLACAILKNTINIFKSMIKTNSNQESELTFFISSLKARRILIQIQFAQNFKEISFGSSQLIIMLLEACDKMSRLEKDFLQCGHPECCAEIVMQQADIQRMIASHTEDEDQKHYHYLEAYALAQRAVRMEEEVVYNILSLFSHHENKNVSLPIMRTLCNMKLNLVELSLEMLQLACTEKHRKDMEDIKKGSLHKLVEEFVRSSPDYMSTQQEWITTGQTLGHTVLAHLDSLPVLSIGCIDLKAKSLYLLGKCLRLVAVKEDPLNQDIWWNDDILFQEPPSSISKYTMSEEEGEEEENERVFQKLQLSTKQNNIYIKKAAKLRRSRSMAQKYLSHASEILLQSMNMAMNNNLIDTLAAASLEIVLCIGRFDPVSSSQYLALHQSCSASVAMKNILLEATFNTSSSQLAALLKLQHHLKEQGDMTSNLLKTVEQRLTETSKAWENLSIHPQHLSLVNDLPSNFNVIILQHSKDKSFLYGSILERSKSNGGLKGKLIQPDIRAKIGCSAVNPDMLFDLLEKMKLYKQKVMQLFYKKNFQKISIIKNMLEPLENSQQKTDMKTAENSINDEDDQELSSDFCHIVEAMEDYLKPLLLQLEFSDDLPETEKIKGKDKDEKQSATPSFPAMSVDMGEYFILLADKLLMELPLEALSFLHDEGISSVSRDFSLQLLYNRIRKEDPELDNKKEGKNAKEPKTKADQKKGTKILTSKQASVTSRTLLVNCIQVEGHHFKYIVDPNHDARELDAVSPTYKINQILEKYHQQATTSWEGVIGSIHVPSYAEWEKLMNNCSAFLFYGMERFLAHILIDKLVAMNFPGKKQTSERKASNSPSPKECQLMILLDLVQTIPSYLRQSKLDTEKRKKHLALETPVETAILLSLTGVRSIMANQWHTTLEKNAKRFDFLCESLLAAGKTTGQTIRDLQKCESPPLPAVEEDLICFDDAKIEALKYPSMLSKNQPLSFNFVLYGLPNLIVI
ncbi:cilia- and flagella-associated protein 46 isoform X2 [Rhinatrema bivittatum]|uniref:cilia- and flagella-associated protein 46 isoform X2 n=1 Tax=Rhinatrema bivittatum TaxID=194408 RepID=UPI00112EC778|nr:cilia- and flagella-associated protein 46 isoform X2 [Rhinatrema bivittatum]